LDGIFESSEEQMGDRTYSKNKSRGNKIQKEIKCSGSRLKKEMKSALKFLHNSTCNNEENAMALTELTILLPVYE
jgi:hypothetical protein